MIEDRIYPCGQAMVLDRHDGFGPISKFLQAFAQAFRQMAPMSSLLHCRKCRSKLLQLIYYLSNWALPEPEGALPMK